MLKKYREKAGMSQSQLAEASGISVRTIQKYEQGERELSNAKAIFVKRLADLLGCKMEDLLNGC